MCLLFEAGGVKMRRWAAVQLAPAAAKAGELARRHNICSTIEKITPTISNACLLAHYEPLYPPPSLTIIHLCSDLIPHTLTGIHL
jgi:hypothetical protein